MTSHDPTLLALDAWIAQGWLTQLNRAFVRFLQQQGESYPLVLWAAALVSHQLERGEVYLDLAALCSNPSATLAISPRWNAARAADDLSTDPWTYLPQAPLSEWLDALAHFSLQHSNAPLVLAEQRLYLRRFWEYQQSVHHGIRQRITPSRGSLPESVLEHIHELFAAPTNSLPDWQKIACVLALRARFCIITGGPGTGKTTTLTKLLALQLLLAQQEAASQQPLTILLAAPTGKAAARVSESIAKAIENLAVDAVIKQALPKKASTLHRLLGSRHNSRHFRHHRQHPLVADIVIIDEASMIDLEMMAALIDALPASTQLILLGDKDQLASVEAGSVMGDLCAGAETCAYDPATLAWIKQYAQQVLPANAVGSELNQQTVMLQISHRFTADSGIGELARAVNRGDTQTAQRVLTQTQQYPDLLPEAETDYLRLRRTPNSANANLLLKKLTQAASGYGEFLHQVQQQPTTAEAYDNWALTVLTAFDHFQVLCALRAGDWGVEALNQRIASWLLAEQANSLWYVGRPVMVTRNDYNVGLMNGDIGITLQDSAGRLRVVFPHEDPLADAKIRWLSPMRLPEVETAFAITVHKSQGSEFKHVALVLPETSSPVLTRELIYTGITRAREQFTLVESAATVFEQAVKSRRKQ